MPSPNGASQPGLLMAELTNPVTLTKNRINTFTAPPSTTLDGDTKYWLTVNEGKSEEYRLDYNHLASHDQSGEQGWTIGNRRLSKDYSSVATWDVDNLPVMLSIQGTPTAGLCKRTPAVSDALVALIPDITRCADVTFAHLDAITGTLDLVHEGITALKSEDFDGLASLEILDLSNNMLSELPAGVFDELYSLEVLRLSDNALDTLRGDVFNELFSLKFLWLDDNALTELPDRVFDELTSLESLWLVDNVLGTLRDDVFDELTSLDVLHLEDNLLNELPDGVFAELTALESLYLAGNLNTPYAPTAIARPDDGRVANGGRPQIRGNLSDGGPWGTNVTYHWALTNPASGVDVSFDDNTSLTPMVTISTLTADTELTFTLTMTGRGGPSGSGIESGTDTATVTVNVTTGICGRTPEVRDELVNRIASVSYCADVTDADLTTLTSVLELQNRGISTLAAGDFAGLIHLPHLWLNDNELSELPAGVFAGLTSLTGLWLNDNELSELPAGVFAGLTSLTGLWLNDNELSELPAGVFAEVTSLTDLRLNDNAPATLPAGGFAGLTSLTDLRLDDNALATLPAGGFAGLTSLARLRLEDNMLDDLPDDVFEPLTSLRDLRLSGNPGRPFAPEAVALPDGGTASSIAWVTLDGSGSGGAWGTNVSYSWALTDPASGVDVPFDDNTNVTPRARIPALAADTELTFTLTVTGRGGPRGSGIASATDTATVMANVTTDATLSDLSLEDGDGNAIALSQPFAPDRAFYTASVAYSIDAVTLTAVQNDSNATLVITNDDDTATLGEAKLDLMVGSNTLTVTVRSEGGIATKPYSVTVTRATPLGICGRTPAVRDALVARISVVTGCADVTDAHLATITGFLNLGNQNITALAAGDFAGLTALTGLDLNDNALATLPDNVFDNALATLPDNVFVGLTSLTTLRLDDNALATLPKGVFDNLTTLEILRLDNNHLTELPAGVFDNLTALTILALNDNALGRLLPDDVFEPLTLLTDLRLSGNRGAPFAPEAVALPDTGTVSLDGGTVALDGRRSGGAWGTNVFYSWALTTPASGVDVSFDDNARAMPEVTIAPLLAGTELTFTLTVTGRGGANGIATDTDTATVTTQAAARAAITDVVFTSLPPDNEYNPGDLIEVSVTFDQNVVVTGEPRVRLEIGPGDAYATYAALSSSSTTLVFQHELTGESDDDTDGVALLTNALDLNAGVIQNEGYTDIYAKLSHDSVQSGINASTRLVKGISITSTQFMPLVFTRGERVYGVGETIEFTVEFKEQVHIAGLLSLYVDLEGEKLSARYAGGSGSSELRFKARLPDSTPIGNLNLHISNNLDSQYGEHGLYAPNGALTDSGGRVVNDRHEAQSFPDYVDNLGPKLLGTADGATVDGWSLDLVYRDAEDPTKLDFLHGIIVPLVTDYTLTADGREIAVSSVHVVEDDRVQLWLDSPIRQGETVTLGYVAQGESTTLTPRGGRYGQHVIDQWGNPAESFQDRSVRNDTIDAANSFLSTMEISGVPFDPEFHPARTRYLSGHFWPEDTPRPLTLTAIPNDPGATLEYFDGAYRPLADLDANVDGIQFRFRRLQNLKVRVKVTPPNGLSQEAMVYSIFMPHARLTRPPTLAVADTTVHEARGAVLEFEVTLSRKASVPVSVSYATKDGTAIAAQDYTRTRGTLEFAPGITRQVVSVPVLDDAVDEGDEDMRLELSKQSFALLGDGTAIGTIVNNDAMPKAWIARFGRTVADQISDAARERMRAGPVPGATLSLGGRSLLGAPRKYDDDEIEPMAEPRFEERTDLSDRALLTGSSFSVATASGEGAVAAVWAKGAVSRFSGEAAEIALDGDVSSVMLGADWRREDWASGVMLAHTRGSGGYEPRSSVQEDEQGTYAGAVESTLTGLYPYGRYTLSDRTTLWGVAGYAAGSLTLTQQDKAPVETDLDLAMGALGVRTVVLDAAGKIGPELAAISDAMMVRTTSAAVSNGAGKLAGARGDVTRIRAGLEGTWHGLEPAAGSLVPHLGVALRHDGGDAETGFGLDVGAGLEWTHPGTGLSAAVRARALASHEASGFDERGLAADLTWDRRRASDRGLSLTIGHTLGASASGGMDALFSRDTLTGLARADDADGPAAHQLDMRLGYGLAAFGGRFTATPEATLALGGERRGYGLGWRLAMRNDRGYGLDLRLQGIRRETDGAGRGADHAIGIEMRVQF